MTDEQLIEEARVAFTEAWEAEDRRVENEDRDARGAHSRSRAGTIAALAVFEKAHAPTDDEREALLRNLYTLRGWTGGDVLRRIEIIDRAMAALSRSEVPEPSADDEPQDELCDCMDRYCRKYHDYQPQGEPTDAQVEAALNAQYRERITRASLYAPENWGEHSGEWSELDKQAMRAALRAAREVNPPVGEKPL